MLLHLLPLLYLEPKRAALPGEVMNSFNYAWFLLKSRANKTTESASLSGLASKMHPPSLIGLCLHKKISEKTHNGMSFSFCTADFRNDVKHAGHL